MTVTEAKTALSVCPPDDDTNPDVPGLFEAMEIAARNPPLKAWWEREKNFDRTFGRKLSSITPPPELAPSIMRGGATIFFASRLIAESMGENPDDDSTLPEVIPAEPILPRSTFTRELGTPAPKPAKKSTGWLWAVAIMVVMLVIIIVLLLLFSTLIGLTNK
jgi:hypothetical protein